MGQIMRKVIRSISDLEIKRAKPREKDYALYDGDGLQLTIRYNGSKVFEFRYTSPTTTKKQKITIGKYPIITLQDAREERLKLQRLLYNGIDPKEEREVQKVKSMTLEAVVKGYIDNMESGICDKTFVRNKGMIDRDILRMLGDRPIKEITRFDVLDVIKDIESRGSIESAKRTLNIFSQIWRYAMSLGIVEHNVALDIDRKALQKSTSTNYPFLSERKELVKLIKDMHDASIEFNTKIALLFSMHTFLRPSNVRYLEWNEIDIDNRVISIPGEKMKTRKPHLVPLTDQTIEILNLARKFNTSAQYVFLTARAKVMSDATMNRALERMGYAGKQTVHGFRHTASTILNENIPLHGIHNKAIERQLAHIEGGVSGVYNKAEYIGLRVQLMEWWSNWINELSK